MNLKSAFLILLIPFLLNSCKNDIEINAPYKETPVVYGFLDAGTDTQYISITKTFQNSSGMTPKQAAQIADSMYFDNTLQVTLINIEETDTTKKYFNFVRVNNIPKDPGYFTNSVNYLYMCPMKPSSANTYKLDIYYPKSGKRYTSVTNIANVVDLMPQSLKYNNYQIEIQTQDELDKKFISYLWYPAKNGLVYNAIIRYWYHEYPDGGSPDPLDRDLKYLDQYVDYNDRSIPTPGSNPSYMKPDSRQLRNISLNTYLQSSFTNIPGIKRSMKELHYIVVTGNQMMVNAIDMSNPNTTLLQVKPEFTNISDGLGIFASRSSITKVIPFADSTSAQFLTQGVPNFIQ